MTGLYNPKSKEWTLLEFGAEVAGPDLWRRYCTAIRNYYEVLDGTPSALNSEEEGLCERWHGLRNAPQSFIWTELLEQIERFEAQIVALIRERLKSGEFIAIGFMGADESEMPPRLFRDNALRIWLAQSEVELPDGTVFRSVVVSPRASVAADPVPFMGTGAPGRPSRGMHMIRAEFDRRRNADECKPTLREEATELEKWFQGRYPEAQPVKLKTIENNIRSDHRNWRENQRSTDS